MLYVAQMTHAERRKRRRLIALAIANGLSTAEAMIRFGVSTETIRKALRENGVKRKRGRKTLPPVFGPKRPQWVLARQRYEQSIERCRSLDWTKPNIVLSRETGLSRERIRQLREKMRRAKRQHKW